MPARENWKCSRCGSDVDAWMDVCWACGASSTGEADADFQADRDPAEPFDIEPPAEPPQWPPRAQVARGRWFFFGLLVLGLTVGVATWVQLGFPLDHWLATLCGWAIFAGLWYACWRGHGWAIGLVAIIAILGTVGGTLPPYSIDGVSKVPGTVFHGLTAIAFLFSHNMRAYFAYQKIRRLHPSVKAVAAGSAGHAEA